MIRNIIFDMGGVIITLDYHRAVETFSSIGVKNAAELLDPYRQSGIFGLLEDGSISDEDFRSQLSQHVGSPLSWEACQRGWLGYMKEVPRRNLECLRWLRQQGKRVVLLSNTNSFVWQWANSPLFSGDGHPISHYIDAAYLSYEMKDMKPSEHIFSEVLRREGFVPGETLLVDDGPRNCAVASELGLQTLCPTNGEDWTETLRKRVLQCETEQ